MADAGKYLSKAPIVEAVFDFQATVGASFDAGNILKMRREIGYEGAKPQEHRGLSFGFAQQEGGPITQHADVDPVIHGYRLVSVDGKYVVQMRDNGMSFSRLAPYLKWETVFAEASRLWAIYCSAVQPETVTRIAVRNINRLVFPQETFAQSPSRFLSAPPVPPQGAPTTVSQWMTRFLLHDRATNLSAYLTQFVDGPPNTETSSVILDVDAFMAGVLPVSPDALLPKFLALRDLKNRLFFSSLTEEAVQLFT